MYIKQIIILGFKSYKNQNIIDPFSPKHNVIVGRNGSGKSNFFAALRFVLNDSYQNMGREERAALLHEGTGAAVAAAYVEVIFDNSDARFPTGTEEVILRRTIGNKKDEYSLNRKNATKVEVMNMLESAGFSKSNPYYIVPQGRVTTITNMKDGERLNMLKTVAGTNVYEERRTESLRIMEDTKHQRAKIDSSLEGIRTKLDELEEEKEELREFQDKDRERRCLEYTVHRQEQEAAEAALQNLDVERGKGFDRNDGHREALEQTEEELEQIERNISELNKQLNVLEEERSQLQDDRRSKAKEKAKIELNEQAMLANQNAAEQTRQQHAAELLETQTQIKQCETSLNQILPDYNQRLEQERALKQQIEDADARKQLLYTKQARTANYKSKRDRDQHLQNEINEINVQLQKRKAVEMDTNEEVAALDSQIQQLQTDIEEMRNRFLNRGDEQQNLSLQVQNAKEEKDRMQDQRKELWREQAKLDSEIANAHAELKSAEQFLGRMLDPQTRRGVESIRELVRKHKVSGTHGFLGELCEFNDGYKTAVNVTAGTSLFHYVVDDEATASRLVQLLKNERGGKLTFVPLSQIRPRTYHIPTDGQVVHLLSRLKFNPEYEKAFQQVFGKTIICPNIQVASQYARSHGLEGITQDGDQADSKGPITGGYFDHRHTRIDGLRRVSRARQEYERIRDRKHEIEQEVEALDQQITRALGEQRKIEQKREQLEGGYGPLRDQIRRREIELNSRQDEASGKQRALERVKADVRAMHGQSTGFQQEMNSDFKKALSSQEENELQRLESQLPELRKQHRQADIELSNIRGTKITLEAQLKDGLRPMLDDLLATDPSTGTTDDASGSNTQLKELQKDLKRLTKALGAADQNLVNTESSIDQTRNQLAQVEQGLAKKQEDIKALQEQIKAHQRSAEKTAAKRAALTQKVTEAQTKIGSLGALPDAAFSAQYQKLTAEVAESRLIKVGNQLKKYGKVNKKAFEQFASFERSREVLENRRKELDDSDTSIRKLIDVLDQRKDEAIERTFRQVSREFASIFEQLVPAGKGRLIIQRRSDRPAQPADDGSDSDEDGEHASNGLKGVENYIGVGISVSFNSKHDEQQRIQQLSGGQKSLCALALVFAIQASDPAPFYLFDEIDANLDAQYRTAVAQLLQKSSQTGQFICTTFRPEMLHVAEKCYGVSYSQKSSSIAVVSREDALGFVEGQIGGGKQ